MMSGQQAVANVLGLEVNVKNGDHGIFVFQPLQPAEEQGFWCTVQQPQAAIKVAPGRSRTGDGKTASPWAPLAWVDQAWEITEGLLEGKQNLLQKGEGSPSTSQPKKHRAQENLLEEAEPASPSSSLLN